MPVKVKIEIGYNCPECHYWDYLTTAKYDNRMKCADCGHVFEIEESEFFNGFHAGVKAVRDARGEI